MKSFKYVIYKEGKYYVSQCLNIDIASCGDSIEEAINNLKDAVALYFRNEPKNKKTAFHNVEEALIGEAKIYA